MNTTPITCPVCGAVSRPNSPGSLHCSVCGTRYAFVEYFASDAVYHTWNTAIRSSWETYRSRNLDRLRSGGKLIVGPEYIAYHDTNRDKLTIFDRSGQIQTQQDVKQYTVSNLHQVTLKTDLTVSARGDNSGGQRRLPARMDTTFALAAPNCTYLVNTNGRVEAIGTSAIRDAVSAWSNIQALACGSSHLAGLTGDGRVVQADSSVVGRTSRETASWTEVTAIAAAANYTLGLRRSGEVYYAGSNSSIAQEVSNWKNITAIAADSQYAVGLNKDGDVLLAGNCPKFLDGGRSEAGSWKNILCIAAGHNVIAAVNTDGHLLLGGSFFRGDDVIRAFNDQNPTQI